MTYTVYIELSCDAPGCDVAYAASPDEQTSRQAVWTGARRVGWGRSEDGGHLCPAHSGSDIPALVALVTVLAAQGLRDGQIGAEVGGWSQQRVQRFRAAHGIRGARPGRPSDGA